MHVCRRVHAGLSQKCGRGRRHSAVQTNGHHGMGEDPGAAARSEVAMINPTEYLPKVYHRRVSTYWWLERWAYLKFILREASSVFVAWTVVVTLLQIRALTRGPADDVEFQNWLRNPLVLVLDAVSLFFVIFHAVTWFNLGPKA